MSLVKGVCLSLLLGFCTSWVVVILTLLGSPVNPYVAWTLLWGSGNLVIVYVTAKNEI